MDLIYLKDLKVDTVIGVHEWERRLKQPLYIDLEMGTDIGRAAQSDDVVDALDYSEVAGRVRQIAAEGAYRLVEALAERIATALREEFSVPWLRLRINKKGAVPGAGDVGVIIERGDKS